MTLGHHIPLSPKVPKAASATSTTSEKYTCVVRCHSLVALSTFGFGCSSDEHHEASTQSQSDALLIPSIVNRFGSVSGTVTGGASRSHTFSSLKTALPLISKQERAVFTISGTSTSPWSCAIKMAFKSDTGTLLKEVIHQCGPADRVEILGSMDPAYNAAMIVVTALTDDPELGADYVVQYVHADRGSFVNQAGTTTASAPTLVSGQRFGGNIWKSEPVHYYAINVPAGKALSLSGNLATMLLSGNVTIKLPDALGGSTTCANAKIVRTMSAGGTALSCSTAAYAADTTVYVTIDNVSAWGGQYDTQIEYDLTPTLD